MSKGVTYLCDRGTGTKDGRRGRVCRSRLKDEILQLQESVDQLTLHQVGDILWPYARDKMKDQQQQKLKHEIFDKNCNVLMRRS